jgi:hypothetical protein
MVGPVQGAVARLVDAWGLGVAPGLAAGLFVLGALVLLLALTVAVTGLVSRAGSLRLAWALLPLGFAMWLAHFAMHLVTGWGAAVPAGLRALGSLGWAPPTASGAATGMAHAMAVPDGLLTLQLLALDLGLLISLYLGWRVAGGQPGDARVGRRLLRVLPYGLLAGALWGMDVWVLLQPMQMRGTMGVG